MSDTLTLFKEELAALHHLERVMTLIDWDLYTATPSGGYLEMSDTLSYFSTKYFLLSTGAKMRSLLEKLNTPAEYDALDEGMRYTVRIMLRDLEKESRIPEAFVREMSDAQSASRKAWEEAKRSSDFSVYAPHLQKMIDLTIRRCEYTDPGKDPYDVLIDRYEEGMTTDKIDRAFSDLKEGLLPLLDHILGIPHKDTGIFDGTYPAPAQKEVQNLLLSYIGFDFSRGTTSVSEHPFTLGFTRNDVRITNHFHEHDPISAMFTSIHEGGHAIFEQNVDPSLKGTAADDCRYMGLHESQSRFFENILGRRKAFWIPVYEKVQHLLPDLAKISLDDFVSEINHVKRSYIRTSADEVTYCLHVILRYEMEQEIFRNHRPVRELPSLWNEKMEKYLHLTVENDAMGILQDMHWSDGSFGYFPSYLLGSIYDGMFLEAMEADLGCVDELLSRGEILTIKNWLSEKIHRFGSLHLPARVLLDVTGKELTPQPLMDYFTKKYIG